MLKLRHFAFGASVLSLLIALGVPSMANAQSVADFYRGKTVTILVGFGPGGGYDLHARTLARYMGKYLPGHPTFVVRNMPGAGGLELANRLYNVSAADGSEIGTFDRSVPLMPLLEGNNARFDSRRFTWIGSTAKEVATCLAWHTSPVKTFADLLQRELVVGGTGIAGDAVTYPLLLNSVLGTKFHIVNGYPGSTEASLAMQRGETQGFCSYSWSTIAALHPDWLKEHKVNVLVQLGTQKPPDHQDIPLATDLAKTLEDRQAIELKVAPQLFARPFVAPPGVPQDRAQALRSAFEATMNDPEYQADASKQGLEVALVKGSEIEAILAKVYATPTPVIERVRVALSLK